MLGPGLDKLVRDNTKEALKELLLPRLVYKNFAPDSSAGFEQMKQAVDRNRIDIQRALERSKRYTHQGDI